MTIVELMEHLKDFIEEQVREYDTTQPAGKLPISVYAGFPPVPVTSKEKASFIYNLVTEFTDEESEKLGYAQVDIGFSIYDADMTEGSKSLFNLMEHIRQALLKRRFIGNGRNKLILPLKGEIPEAQPFPQWQGIIHATYTIGQPREEGLDFDSYQETKTPY